MKIEKFDFWPVLVPDYRLLNFSGLHAPFVLRILIRAIMSDGSIGWSEIPCNSGILLVLRTLAGELVGKHTELATVNNLLEWVVSRSRKITQSQSLADTRGAASFDQGVTNHVRAGVQMALYAAIAEHMKVPLCDVLGGENGRKRNQVMFNLYLFFLADTAGSGLDYSSHRNQPTNEFEQLREGPVLNAEQAVKFAKAALENLMPGVTLVKWKAGVLSPEQELEVMFALADVLDPSIQILPDPNGAWTVETAVWFIRQLKARLGERLPYFEDPCVGLEAMRQVHLETNVKLATNMWAPDLATHIKAKKMGAIQVTLGGDVHYIGGSDMSVALSHWCVENGVAFANHSNSHLGVSDAHTVHAGAAAAEHNLRFDTHYDPWHKSNDIIVPHPIPLLHGGIKLVPERPGLGVDVNLEGVLTLHELFLQANSGSNKWENRDDGPPADKAFGSWKRPKDRPVDQQWFMAGISTTA